MQIDTIFYLLVLLFSVILHEVSHGLAANALGDPTAKYQGRLTFNPVSHIDPVGSVLVPAALLLASGGAMAFGWAKPVPYNPYNLRDQKWGELKVALAGPVSNLLLAACAGIAVRLLVAAGDTGSPALSILGMIIGTNLVLAVFNLIPVPPLDGSKVLFAFLPYGSGIRESLEKYGFVLVLLVVFYGWKLVFPLVTLLFDLIVGT